MATQPIDWSSLWKKDEWLAVWIGFLIIILFVAGLTIKTPNFRWTTDGEFNGLVADQAPTIQALLKGATDKNEPDLAAALQGLQKAIEGKDRKAIGAAGKKVADVSKNVKDGSLKKAAGDMGGTISSNAGRLPGNVLAADNILWSVYIGIGFLILAALAMAVMGEKVGSFIAGFPVVYVLAWIAMYLAGNY